MTGGGDFDTPATAAGTDSSGAFINTEGTNGALGEGDEGDSAMGDAGDALVGAVGEWAGAAEGRSIGVRGIGGGGSTWIFFAPLVG